LASLALKIALDLCLGGLSNYTTTALRFSAAVGNSSVLVIVAISSRDARRLQQEPGQPGEHYEADSPASENMSSLLLSPSLAQRPNCGQSRC
jgi:hypothetical protein